MNKKIYIGLGILAAIGIGFGIYAYKKKKSATTTSVKEIPGNATPDQFNKLVETANKGGSDWFQGATPEKLKEFLTKWTANLTKSDGEVLITTIGKKEKDWTPTEKIKFTELFTKWTGKKI